MSILEKGTRKFFSREPTLEKSEELEVEAITRILSDQNIEPCEKARLLSQMVGFIQKGHAVSSTLAGSFSPRSSMAEEGGLGSQPQQGDQSDPRNMYPPIGLGGQTPTGQSQQEEMRNQSFPPNLTPIRRKEIIRTEEYAPQPGATPAPNTGNPAVQMDHEEDSGLQPAPKTPEGQAAEAQRAAMKNPASKIPTSPGQSGSSQVYSNPQPWKVEEEGPVSMRPGGAQGYKALELRLARARAHPALIPLKQYSGQHTEFRKSFMTSVSGDSYQVESVYKGADGKSWYLEGIASDGDVDLDGDRMTPKALTTMAQALNGGINVFVDHEHTVGKLIGTTVKGEVLGNKVKTVVKLEDPETNPTVASILSKLDTGARLGFSIGGDLTESHIGWDGSESIRDIDGVNLLELSVVGLPANPRSFVTGSSYKGKA